MLAALHSAEIIVPAGLREASEELASRVEKEEAARAIPLALDAIQLSALDGHHQQDS